MPRTPPNFRHALLTALVIISVGCLAYAQNPAPGTQHSAPIALQPGERLLEEPLRRGDQRLSLYSYVDAEDRGHIRIRHLGEDLAVTSTQDVHPPSGYEAAALLSVAGGAEVVAVLRPSDSDAGAPVLLAGYATATGTEVFRREATGLPTGFTDASIYSATDASGRHVGVGIVFADGSGEARVALLSLGAEGALETYAAERTPSKVDGRLRDGSLFVGPDGRTALALSDRKGLHLFRADADAAALTHEAVALPDGHRAATYAWLPADNQADAPVLIGMSIARRLFSREVATFSIALPDARAAAASTSTLQTHPYTAEWPRSWRRMRSAEVAYAEPLAVQDEVVAFAAQKVTTRRGGHPRQQYRPLEHRLGDILVTVLRPDGRVAHAEVIARDLQLDHGGARAGSAAGIQFIDHDGGVGLLYADEAGSYLSARDLLSGRQRPELTIWRPIGLPDGRRGSQVVHDDASAYVGLPATGVDASGSQRAFVTVAEGAPEQREPSRASSTPAAGAESSPGTRVRVVLASQVGTIMRR